MDVSIIIVNYNTEELTKQCVDSVFGETGGLEFEVIVVDNASTDGSRKTFTKDRRISYYYLDKNLGFGKANNYGIRQAKGKYVFCLNSDTVLQNNAVKEFFDFAESQRENVGAIGCLLQRADGNRIHSFGTFLGVRDILLSRILSPLCKLAKRKYSLLDDPRKIKGDTFEVDYVTGADMFVRRALLDEYGLFDDDFFMYFEETELQHRLTRNGYKSMVITAPQITHLEGASINDKEDKSKRMMKRIIVQKSQFLYIYKTRPYFKYATFRVFFFLLRLPYVAFSPVSLKLKKDYMRMLVAGIEDCKHKI